MNFPFKKCFLIALCFCLSAGMSLPAEFEQARSYADQRNSNWQTATPESQGVDSAALAEAIESARQRGLNIHSFLLVRNGRLVAESYFFPYDGKTPHDIASVTKPITTTLIGLAIAQGKIESVNQPMLSLFAGRNIANTDERKQRVQLRHLLTMSSGLACKAQAGEPTLWEMLSAADNTQFMLDLPMVAEPGGNYVYCSGGMHLLSAALKQRTGMNAEAFARKHLFAPLGITNLIWPRDAQQVSHGFGNLHLLPRDMAKLGQLFLDGGKWQGRQLVPAAWVKEATRSHIKTGGAGSSDYGYGWRVPTNGGLAAFEAGGRGGQQISVLPAKNAVVVFNGGGFSSAEFMKQVQAALKSDQALPENPAALARLNAAIANVAKAPAPQTVAALSAVAQTVSGKTFELEKNWLGLKTLSLSFRPGEATATATLQFEPALKQYQWGLSAKVHGNKTVLETRAIGLDGVPRFSGDGIAGLPVALKGGWESDGSFVLEYDEVANTNTHRLQMTFDGNRVKVAAKERTGLFNETFGGQTATSSNSAQTLPRMMFADDSRGRPFSKDPHVIFFKGRYLMYYSLPSFGDGRAKDGWAIGIAESNDLTTWKKAGEILPQADYEAKGMCAPGALIRDGKVHLFYQTYGNGPKDAICHAMSDDGISFTRDATNPVFRPAGNWTSGRAIDAEVLIDGPTAFLYFATRDPESKIQKLGVATASSKSDFGRAAWKQASDESILFPQLPWEGECIEAASVIKRGREFVMFYAGAYNNWPQQVGVAVSRDGLHWRRASEQPFLTNGKPGEWNAAESGHPHIFLDRDGRTYLFFQGNKTQGKDWYLSKVEVFWRNGRPSLKP